ncbi:IFT74 [Symbiodinium sp. KB8]|nr:IFT74 [Symbiodinium sp. KB8]
MSGVGLNTQVVVSARPVTQQGMAGMRTATGRGRQVQDSSYHMAQLRRRITEISAEIRRMGEEYTRMQKDTATHATLQRRYDECIKEVRSLEGELADYNLAMDKARTSVDPAEVRRYQEQLASHNAEASREIDMVFVDRQEREQGVRRLEAQIEELQSLAESRLSSLPAAKLAEYRKIMAGSRTMHERISGMQGQLEQLNSAIASAEAQLSADTHREEAALLERKLEHLRRDEEELAGELDSAALDPGAARSKLLGKVKADNAAIQEMDKELRTKREALARARATAKELREDVERRSGDGGEGQKYEALFAKDQQMTQFIDSFPAAKAKEEAAHAQAQDTIVALLEHISGEVEREQALPSLEQAEALKGELKDKETELARSKATKERLRGELTARQGELKRLETLGSKIASEVSSLQANIARMRGEMPKLEDIPALQAAADAASDALQGQLMRFTERADSLRHVVADVRRREESLASQLAHDPMAQSLQALESRMKHYEQSIFAMRECACSHARAHRTSVPARVPPLLPPLSQTSAPKAGMRTSQACVMKCWDWGTA